MKLIDLLVRELPKRGGWPEHVNYIAQDAGGLSRGKVYGYVQEPDKRAYYWLNADENDHSGYGEEILRGVRVTDDCKDVFVSREQYEIATQPA